MGNELAVKNDVNPEILEKVLVYGDLEKLSPEDRLLYFKKVCDSVGLNYLTKPFEFIKLNGKLVLYAVKGCTDQLRAIHNISLSIQNITSNDQVYMVQVTAMKPDGRTDSDVGIVSISGLKGDALANAIMKAVTKAKRRCTLSICGLGWLDETEIETIPDAVKVDFDVQSGNLNMPEDPAEVIEDKDEYRCDTCGETIPDVVEFKNKKYKVNDWVKLTKLHFDKDLCPKCSTKNK